MRDTTASAAPAADVPSAAPTAAVQAPAPRACAGPDHPTATGAHSDQAASVITDARARIDALDARIIDLIRERVDVSAAIQRERIASGGRRVHLAREMEVLTHYSDRLGRLGTTLAMTLLELSRGTTAG